jgi:hypothetical protein
VYSQWEEAGSQVGESTREVGKAKKDLAQASIALLNQEPVTALNHLVLAETTLFSVLQKVGFNEAFYSVVSFCAWSVKRITLAPDIEVSFEPMLAALDELERRPFIDLAKASELVDTLELAGWNGDSPAVEAFKVATDLPDTCSLQSE